MDTQKEKNWFKARWDAIFDNVVWNLFLGAIVIIPTVGTITWTWASDEWAPVTIPAILATLAFSLYLAERFRNYSRNRKKAFGDSGLKAFIVATFMSAGWAVEEEKNEGNLFEIHAKRDKPRQSVGIFRTKEQPHILNFGVVMNIGPRETIDAVLQSPNFPLLEDLVINLSLLGVSITVQNDLQTLYMESSGVLGTALPTREQLLEGAHTIIRAQVIAAATLDRTVRLYKATDTSSQSTAEKSDEEREQSP